jgi:excisionase family DNA binding protein
MIDPRFEAAVDAILKDPWPDDPTPGYLEVGEAGTWELRPPAPARLLIDVREAARMLGCGRSLLYQLIAAGELHVIKLGRLSRIPIAAVEALVARKVAERGQTGRPWWEDLEQ